MSVLPVHVPAALAAAARTQSTTATTTETAARSKNVVMRGEAADGEPQSSVRAEVKDDGKRSQHAPASAIADATEMAASSAATARASAREREQQRQAHASLPPPPRVIPAAIASSTPVIPRAADHGGAADEEEEDVEEADMDFDAEFGFEPVTPNPPPILSLNGALTAPRGPKSKTQAGREAVGGAIPTDADADADAAAATRNISPRRVQSAPTNLLKIYDESLLLEHDDEEDEWFVPSVKAKAERRLGRKGGLVGAAHDNDDDDDEDDAHTFGEKAGRGGLRAVAPAPGENMESWDDDFDADGEDDGDAAGQTLRIPDAVQNLQHQIKGDAVNLKKFALHIEGARCAQLETNKRPDLSFFSSKFLSDRFTFVHPDLKLLNSDAADMAAGVPASSRSRLAAVRARYAADLLKVQVLIALGDYAEDDNDVDGSPASQAPTEQHLQVLVDMMVGGTDRRGAGGKGGGGGGGGGGLPPAAARELERMVRDGTLVFGVELMPALIKHMAPLKLSLSKYVEDVRAVLLTAET
ncbi:hypothetical protein BDZ88DRAFT_236336 [Geranomyces variabilis]|nr:hypothetical protein BDZ88DRAFT_236336 [Geranomyces variabilis]KAJ3141199.1 hypothetical protein HDU90_007225 [Geranomyces variabilis]